jgi:hypothetical protein
LAGCTKTAISINPKAGLSDPTFLNPPARYQQSRGFGRTIKGGNRDAMR